MPRLGFPRLRADNADAVAVAAALAKWDTLALVELLAPDGAKDRWRSAGNAAPLLGRPRVQDLPGAPTVLVLDATADDSNKDFPVTAGGLWLIATVFVELTTTSTAGNRHILVSLQRVSDSQVMLRIDLELTQAASLTRRYQYVAGHGATDGGFGAVSGNLATMPLLLPAWLDDTLQLNVQDAAGIAPAADDMAVTIFGYEVDE